MRVLMITTPLPTHDRPNTMAPLARQIASLREIGVSVDVLEVQGIPKLKYLQAIPALQSSARRVDLVHAHFGYCGWLGYLQFSAPLVVSYMGDDLLGTPTASGHVKRSSRVAVQMNRWLARMAKAVIVKSREMAKVVHPVSAHVVPNGVDLASFRPMDTLDAKRELGWSEHKRLILFPGNPDCPRKNFPLAHQAVAEANRQTGDTLELVSLQRVDPSQVPLYMNACEAMILTSHIEGSPNVVKEAMACNLPVVSVPVGDVAELFDDVAGYHVCPRDADSLSAALVRVLAESRSTDGVSAIKRKGLDLATVARRLHNIYEQVLTCERNLQEQPS